MRYLTPLSHALQVALMNIKEASRADEVSARAGVYEIVPLCSMPATNIAAMNVACCTTSFGSTIANGRASWISEATGTMNSSSTYESPMFFVCADKI